LEAILRDAFNEAGIEKAVIGKTEDLGVSRAREIQQWLADSDEDVENYVVIDEDPDGVGCGDAGITLADNQALGRQLNAT
jgi:hypothetical protein